VQCFLSKDLSEDDILAQIPCSRQEIAKLRQLVEKIQVLNAFCVESTPARQMHQGKVREKFGPDALGRGGAR